MTDLSITEATSVQFPMIRHVAAVGWTPLAPHAALRKRGGEAGTLVRDEVEAALGRFNPWLPADAIRAVIEKIEALPPKTRNARVRTTEARYLQLTSKFLRARRLHFKQKVSCQHVSSRSRSYMTNSR